MSFRMLGRLCAFVIAMSLTCSSFGARLYLDSRPTNLDATDKYCDVLLREIPRQMLIRIAIDELGAETIDATLEQGAKSGNHVRLGLQRKQNRDGHILHIDLFDAGDDIIDTSDIGYTFLAHGLPRLQDMVKNMDVKNHDRWLGILSKQLSLSPKQIKWDASLPAPEKVKTYLQSIDFQNAYLAARLVHKEVSASGESPARLSALIRAYAHLAEACFDINSPHGDAMWARAYVYANRLATMAPNEPLSYWTRAYLESLHGLVLDAQDDFKHATELAKGAEAPSWASLAQEMIAYNTTALVEQSTGENSALASYFAWRIVEHSGLSGLTIRQGQFAQKFNPDSLRVQDSIAWNSSLSTLAKWTIQAPSVLNRIITRLADAPADEVNDAIRNSVQATASNSFEPDAVRKMLSSISSTPRAQDEPHLPWNVYASMLREWEFVQVFSRLFYIDYDTCADPDGESERLMPLVDGHRYAPLIASFDRHGNAVPARLLNQIRRMHFADDTLTFDTIHVGHYLAQIGIPSDSPHHTNWSNHCAMLSNKTAYDVATGMWLFRNTEGPNTIPDRKNNSDLLDQLSPNHPAALYWLVTVDPDKVVTRAAMLQRDFAHNAPTNFAIGALQSRLHHFDQAEILLNKAAAEAPDAPIYRELAEINLMRDRDIDAYLKTWDQYFAQAGDTSQNAGLVKFEIALKLLKLGEFTRAIPFAREGRAGTTASTDALILALTRSGNYEGVLDFYRDNSAGVGGSGNYYRWCRETGRGGVERAKVQYMSRIPDLIATRRAGELTNAGVFYCIESDPGRAAEILETAALSEPENCAALILAMEQLQQKKIDAARQTLQNCAEQVVVGVATRAYAKAARDIAKYLDDPNVALDLPIDIADPTNYFQAPSCGNVFYAFGKVCELKGDKGQAIKWYRKSLDVLSSGFPARPMAAMALRNLGEEYYK